MTRDDLMNFAGPAAMNPGIEGAMFAQLEEGEDLDNLAPARGATIATRAALLSAIPLDWAEEVAEARKFHPDFLRDLAVELATGEIEPLSALRKLTVHQARLACLAGSKFLGEVIRLIDEEDVQAKQLAEEERDCQLDVEDGEALEVIEWIEATLDASASRNRPGEGSPDPSTSAPSTPRPEGPG